MFGLLLTAWVQEELTSAQLLVLGSFMCAPGSFVSQREWNYFWAGGCSQHSYLGACSGVVSVPCGTQRNHRNHRNLRSPHRERELKEVLKGNLRGVGALLGGQKQKEKLNE